jgi:transposase InsO family protein
MKCVTKEDGYDILREIHEGVCGNNAASRMLVGKAYRAGLWWPTAASDAEDLVRRCQNCQFFGKQSHVPAHSLITIPPSWPFACWSLDMIGPFTTAPGGFTHVLVAIDKFTKWMEYKPIAKLTPDRVVDFISDILHRFGFPNTIITDLGSNFTANQFWEFCENSCIEIKYVSVAHPRDNGQVERVNDMIIDGLKKDSMTKIERKETSGYTNCHMSFGGSGLSRPKPQDKHHSSLCMALKLSCRPTSCGNLQGLKCTMKARRTRQGS